jgi:hypothetical protein
MPDPICPAPITPTVLMSAMSAPAAAVVVAWEEAATGV